MKVFKYRVDGASLQVIRLPKGAKILQVAWQRHQQDTFLWALVDPEAPLVSRTFYLMATGQEMGDAEGLLHVGTFQMGVLVWHLFEVTRGLERSELEQLYGEVWQHSHATTRFKIIST